MLWLVTPQEYVFSLEQRDICLSGQQKSDALEYCLNSKDFVDEQAARFDSNLDCLLRFELGSLDNTWVAIHI